MHGYVRTIAASRSYVARWCARARAPARQHEAQRSFALWACLPRLHHPSFASSASYAACSCMAIPSRLPPRSFVRSTDADGRPKMKPKEAKRSSAAAGKRSVGRTTPLQLAYVDHCTARECDHGCLSRAARVGWTDCFALSRCCQKLQANVGSFVPFPPSLTQ